MAFYALLGLWFPLRAAAADLWPLRMEPKAITGTFMEPRSAHYHSGLDIRTGGRIGVEVQAPVGGWIERLRTSPEGYGKAIYLRADDGRSFVFAHLSAFAEPLQQRITAHWSRTRRYQSDFTLGEGELRVAAGDLIALSGATGTGAPHLHVEIRDGASRPMNPLRNGLEFEDDVAPEIEALRVVALGLDSWIEGDVLEKEFRAGETVEAYGRVGIEVRASDRAPNAPFRLMPYSIELSRDDESVFAMRQDRFDFSQSGQMRLEIRRESGARWVRLYPREANQLPGRRHRDLELADDGEPHEFELRVADAAGNETAARFTLRGVSASEELEAEGIDYGQDFVRWRISPGGEVGPGLANGRLPYAELPAWFGDSGPSDAAGSTGGRPMVLGVYPGFRSHLGDDWQIDATGDAFFPGGFLEWVVMESRELPATAGGAIGTVYELRPHGIAFDGVLRMRPRAALPRQAGPFLRDRRGNWKLLDRDGDDWLLGDYGTLAVFRDQGAPKLGSWRDADGTNLRDGHRLRRSRARDDGIGGPLWPTVLIPVADELAGFEAEGLQARLDGKPWPARWDPEDEFLAFDFFVDPGPGAHLLELVATDRLGNVAASSLRIELLPD